MVFSATASKQSVSLAHGTASAAVAIENIAAQSSATVYIYDLAEQISFGASLSSSQSSNASTVKLQTRAGAGLGIVGFLTEGTSSNAVKGSVLTALTTPIGLAAMANSLSYLPNPEPRSKLVIHVAAVTAVGDNLTFSSTLSPLSVAWHMIPENNVVIMASASPQEAIDLAAVAYQVKAHVIHFFDYLGSAREIGNNLKDTTSSETGLSIHKAIKAAGYAPFDYYGDRNATVVSVFLNGPLALAAKAAGVDGLGIIIVRLVRPWKEEDFRSMLPSKVTDIHVFDDVPNNFTQGNLFMEILGTLGGSGKGPLVHSHGVTPTKGAEYAAHKQAFCHVLQHLRGKTSKAVPLPQEIFSNTKKLLFIDSNQSPQSKLPQLVQGTLKHGTKISARLLIEQDELTASDGIAVNRLILAQSGDSSDGYPVSLIAPLHDNSFDFLAILDHRLLATHSILQYAKDGSVALVITPWSSTEFVANLPRQTLALVCKKHLRVYLFNPAESQLSQSLPDGKRQNIRNALVHAAFMRLYLGPNASELSLRAIDNLIFGGSVEEIPLAKIIAHSWIGLREAEISSVLAGDETGQAVSLKSFEFNTISNPELNVNVAEPCNTARLSSWHDAAKHLLFPLAFAPQAVSTPREAGDFAQDPRLRPEVPEQTFLATCKVNRRLTPVEYDRNIFHLEFDTSGTGLKYAIGEALGVHGWNDEQDVLEFCQWYQVDPDQLITIPVAAGSDLMHTRTVFQALQQQIDLFGRPPKAFYSELAEYASDTVDRHALLFIGSAEGSYTLKKLVEKDTVNFVDVLKLYPSAGPGIERLCEMVGDIKPRHYSIASAQAVVGDQVDLLVVSVHWIAPNGSPKYGQCTRYLAGLKIGQKVTVSIKPSVMKLPPHSTQPIIMAGLGTGAAPFRAFLQYTAFLAQKGLPTGPVYYYFGSRYQAQEYLYGEEIEAYILGGTITKAGLAFSRDSKKKVYIQHLMLEDARVLAKMLKAQDGVFYLCGPTWPVPDVYEALVGALVKYEGYNNVTAGEFLESLKEEERYVLEVY